MPSMEELDQNQCLQADMSCNVSLSLNKVKMRINVHGKQLRSCQDGQLLNHTVPRQASRIKGPFFRQ